MTVDPNNAYIGMTKDVISQQAARWTIDSRDHVVGSFDAHNNHEGYQLLFDGISTQDMVALDFGCGPGRNIVQHHDKFKRIDGADISEINLANAAIWCAHNNIEVPTLYKTDGVSLNDVPSNFYNFVFSTIVMQHIAVHDIRFAIMEEMYRVLKPGGWVSLQMGYGPDKQDAVDYFDNFYEAGTTNGNMDVRITSPDQPETDLKKIGFVNISSVVDVPGPGCNHSAWIYFRGQK